MLFSGVHVSIHTIYGRIGICKTMPKEAGYIMILLREIWLESMSSEGLTQ